MGEGHKSVLSVSPDRELSALRHTCLSQAGFYVVSVLSEPAARYEIYFGQCGVLLLCHKLSPWAREALATDFHRVCHDPFIVAVLAHERDHHPPEAHVRVVHSTDSTPLITALSQKLAA
jgi:hypothetical protein